MTPRQEHESLGQFLDRIAQRKRNTGDRYRETLLIVPKQGGKQEVLDALNLEALQAEYKTTGPTVEEYLRMRHQIMKKTQVEGSWEDDAADTNR